jgi:choline kinase
MIYTVILAAGAEILGDSANLKSLLKESVKTILERQIEILKWFGINGM